MTTRKLNPLELRIHQTAISSSEKTLTQKELIALVPDVAARTEALNFLLGTGLLKAMTRSNGVVSAYRAVMKREMDVKKDMSGEEAMVLSHIQAAGNKGIWTKHLKAKTELHQTVIDRCLKSLLQKQLVKVVKSVEHRTRKMYMLSHLEPSVELTGGPWYTDNELDTEFIKNLSAAILLYIKDRSFPKQKKMDDSSPHAVPLFPISSAPPHPTAQQIQTFLSKSKITETRLTIEHVEMLLNVLILDGQIEKVPAFGAALWDSGINDGDDEEEEGEDIGQKRKYKTHHGKGRPKRKRGKTSKETDSEDESPKKSKKRRRAEVTDTTESDEQHRRTRKKKHRADDSKERPSSSHKRSKKTKRVSSDSPSSSSTTSSSDSETDEDEKRSRRSKKSSRKRSASPSFNLGDATTGVMTSAYVYRAIRQERVALGWSQAPCGRCPVFDFCRDKGPVNPTECIYYEEWLGSEMTVAEA